MEQHILQRKTASGGKHEFKATSSRAAQGTHKNVYRVI
jgi:hypothetical protein